MARPWRGHSSASRSAAGIIHLSANLDFHGIGQDARLDNHPLGYTLEPTSGFVRAKYRLADSTFWAGLGYALR